MIKGWKNNPAWVAYYKQVKEQRRQRRIEVIRSKIGIDQLMAGRKRLSNYSEWGAIIKCD